MAQIVLVLQYLLLQTGQPSAFRASDPQSVGCDAVGNSGTTQTDPAQVKLRLLSPGWLVENP